MPDRPPGHAAPDGGVGETVNLAVEDKGEAVILTQVECREMMRALSQPGTRAPLYCSGVGKALLAALPEEESLAVLKGLPLRRITDRTLTGPDDLARTWPRPGSAASPSTTRSTRSGCAAWRPRSMTSMAGRSAPCRSPAPPSGSPMGGSPNWEPWSAAPPGRSPGRWAAWFRSAGAEAAYPAAAPATGGFSAPASSRRRRAAW